MSDVELTKEGTFKEPGVFSDDFFPKNVKQLWYQGIPCFTEVTLIEDLDASDRIIPKGTVGIISNVEKAKDFDGDDAPPVYTLDFIKLRLRVCDVPEYYIKRFGG